MRGEKVVIMSENAGQISAIEQVMQGVEEDSILYENRLKLFLMLLDLGSVIVDVGVNYGQHFIKASQRFNNCYGGGECIGFEAGQEYYDYVNSLKLNATLRNVGISSSPGKRKFINCEGLNGAFSALEQTLSDAPKTERFEEIIETSTLDIELDGRLIDLIKIDVEGGEYNVLKGAQNTLANSKPLVVVEHGGKRVGKLFGYAYGDFCDLFPVGYSIYGLDFEPYTEKKFCDGSPWMQIAVPLRFQNYFEFIRKICLNKSNSHVMSQDFFGKEWRISNSPLERGAPSNVGVFSSVIVGGKRVAIDIPTRVAWALARCLHRLN